MEHDIKYGGLFRQKRKLETLLLAIGFALFIFLGARGLDKISDKAVAAGETYKTAGATTLSAEQRELTGPTLNSLASISNKQATDLKTTIEPENSKKADAREVSNENSNRDNNNRSEKAIKSRSGS